MGRFSRTAQGGPVSHRRPGAGAFIFLSPSPVDEMPQWENRLHERINEVMRPFYESASLLSARLDAVEEILAKMVDAAIATDPELIAELRVRLEILRDSGPRGEYLH